MSLPVQECLYFYWHDPISMQEAQEISTRAKAKEKRWWEKPNNYNSEIVYRRFCNTTNVPTNASNALSAGEVKSSDVSSLLLIILNWLILSLNS